MISRVPSGGLFTQQYPRFLPVHPQEALELHEPAVLPEWHGHDVLLLRQLDAGGLEPPRFQLPLVSDATRGARCR